MKKMIFVLGLSLVTLASCTKEYTCECTYTDQAGIEPSYSTQTTLQNTKQGAEDNCDYLSGTSYAGSVVYNKTCVIID
ncbi:MAG: hypothetical protein R2799_13215 [Crocinitomicaceae bacterium]